MIIINHTAFFGAAMMVLIVGVVLYLIMTMGNDE